MRERETVLCGLVWRGVVCGAVCSLRSQAYDVREQTVGVFFHIAKCVVWVYVSPSLFTHIPNMTYCTRVHVCPTHLVSSYCHTCTDYYGLKRFNQSVRTVYGYSRLYDIM